MLSFFMYFLDRKLLKLKTYVDIFNHTKFPCDYKIFLLEVFLSQNFGTGSATDGDGLLGFSGDSVTTLFFYFARNVTTIRNEATIYYHFRMMEKLKFNWYERMIALHERNCL